MALIYLMRPWTSTNAENFQTSRVNYILIFGKNVPTQHIYVKSGYSTPQFQKDQLILSVFNEPTTPLKLALILETKIFLK